MVVRFGFFLCLGIIYLAVIGCNAPRNSAPSAVTAIPDCRPTGEYQTPNGKGKRFDCPVKLAESGKQKTFYVLALSGTFPETAEQQGYLMAEETDRGPMRQIVETLVEELSSGKEIFRPIKKAFLGCVIRKMESSVSSEFVGAVDGFFKGYLKRFQEIAKDRPVNPVLKPGDRDKLMAASLAIELDNIIDSIKYRIGKGGITRALTIADLLKTCGKEVELKANGALEAYLLTLFPDHKPHKFGCTGFISPASSSKEGQFIHARNLDADLVKTWNEAPTLFLIHERGYLPYVSAAAGGLVYAGGISGYNKAKITASLHQMYPAVYGIEYPNREAAIAPFLQQRILREAESVEEAAGLIRSTKHFGSWTLFIGDGKTDRQKIVSTEFSPENVSIARSATDLPMVQTNHFISPKTVSDAYSPNYNRYLESRARMKTVQDAVKSAFGNVDFAFALHQMASHRDALEGLRSFGKTPTKAYNLMSTIALPQKNQFWVTLGERLPASHSTFLGFEIDLDKLTAVPIGTSRVDLYRATPSWEDSLQSYVLARESYLKGDLESTLQFLDMAIGQAERDSGKFPSPPHLGYYFMKARVLEKTGKNTDALAVWNKLWERIVPSQMHDYQRALVALHRGRLLNMVAPKEISEATRKDWSEAKEVFGRYQRETPHPDLVTKLEMIRAVEKGETKYPDVAIDFVAIE